jgi:hypothetical protein
MAYKVAQGLHDITTHCRESTATPSDPKSTLAAWWHCQSNPTPAITTLPPSFPCHSNVPWPHALTAPDLAQQSKIKGTLPLKIDARNLPHMQF